MGDLLKANPVYLGAGAINTFYAWPRLAYGFKDENIRPYNINSAPFMMKKSADASTSPQDLGLAEWRLGYWGRMG